MGGSMGNPIDEAAQARINQKIEDVVKYFGVEFSKAYTQVTIEKAKAEIESEPGLEDSLKLQEPPVPSAILKSGILIKRGESVKNWKNRFFVARNADKNFQVEYYDGTDEKGKLKGIIYPAGYYAYEFNSDDVAEHGEKGIKLVPWSWRRRTWWIKCGDDNERKEWLSAFETACYKARPPHDEDEVIAKAFDLALRNTRWNFWFWGWYGQAGNEAERLGEFLLDLLDRDIVNEILNGIAESPAKAMTVDLVRKTIGTSVKAACSSAWASSSTAVRSVSDKIQSQVKDLIAPIIEKQKEFKNMIVDKIGGKINPFLADKGSSLLRPVLNIIFKPIIQAFEKAAKLFHAHVQQHISNGEFGAAKFDSTLSRIDWQMDWWSGPIHDSYHIVWKMYTSDMTELLSILSGGITPYSVYNLVMDKLKVILHRAVFTFGNLAKSVNESELGNVLSHVTGLLFHDALIMIKSTVLAVLKSIIDAPVQELVLKPCGELIAPLQETLDAIPIPGLPVLIDLNELLNGTVDDIVTNAILAIIGGSVNDIKTALGVASAELGIANVNLNDD
eukprot:CAMPEP_0173144378 /NCGR_PEP_ID=MMETSP1105-20130129/7195_1 /TAXON_ID=2985 /ORGANISM="Ochromonas sp., Strain BG-1" /LENGTH=558 /DNA_ID=CAMNT_0014058043 /DNA_START=49 /DNA_END=1725 /DNA_ORIENTATION=-